MLTETVIMRDDSAYSGVSSFGFGGTNAHGEAWGKNIMTSRGVLGQDTTAAFDKKLAQAPPAEITMNGDDVNDWDTTGLDPRAEAGSKWRIQLDEDGIATWEKADDDIDYGDEFFIRGSHNNWSPEVLERDDTITGLWTGTLEIGGTGMETFQVIADSDTEKCYYPRRPGETLKAAPIEGPSSATTDLAWCVKGAVGDTIKVEFFLQDKHKSILWMKQA